MTRKQYETDLRELRQRYDAARSGFDPVWNLVADELAKYEPGSDAYVCVLEFITNNLRELDDVAVAAVRAELLRAQLQLLGRETKIPFGPRVQPQVVAQRLRQKVRRLGQLVQQRRPRTIGGSAVS